MSSQLDFPQNCAAAISLHKCKAKMWPVSESGPALPKKGVQYFLSQPENLREIETQPTFNLSTLVLKRGRDNQLGTQALKQRWRY